MPAATRRLAPLALPLLLAACDPLTAFVSAANDLTLAPDPATFQQLDCDGNARLTAAEATSRITLRTKAAPTLHGLTAAEFQAGDADGDGGWTYAEMRAALTGATAWSVSQAACGG